MLFGTFLASEIRLLRRILDSRGLDAAAILGEAGIDPALSERPRARYPSERVAEAWARAAVAAADPDLGFDAANSYRPTDFHGLAVVFLASSDLRTAMGRLARYNAVVNTAAKLYLEEGSDRLDLVCETQPDREERRRVIEDVRAAVLIDICRTAVAGPLDPLEMHFTYRRPASTAAHDALLRCRLVFGAEHWRLSFRRRDAERPFLASNRELARSNDRVLDEVVRSLQQDDLVSRVKRALAEELASGAPSEEAVARAVSMSPRSLQRRLAGEGASFTGLLGEVRRTLAERYVLDASLPMTEIAYMLGFSDPSAFSRAFKRWTGQSPAVARRSAAS